MDLRTRQKAFAQRGPAGAAGSGGARGCAGRRNAALGLTRRACAAGASSTTTRPARAAAGLALEGMASPAERQALERSRRHAVYDRAAPAERAPYGRPPAQKSTQELGAALAHIPRRTPPTVDASSGRRTGTALAAAFARAGLTKALGVVLEACSFARSCASRPSPASRRRHPGATRPYYLL